MSVQAPERPEAAVDSVTTGALPSGRAMRARFAVAAIVLGAALAGWLGTRGGTGPASARPPAWHAGVVPCRAEVLAHVQHPTRLVVLRRCATVTGVVRSVRYHPENGDWAVVLTPDAGVARMLPRANGGLLSVRVIPTDVHNVQLPRVGEQVDAYGAWVLNKNAHRQAQLHPAWAIVPHGAASAPRPIVRPGLSLAVHAPHSSPIGAVIPVVVGARMAHGPRATPASRVHLFLEMTAADGRAVDWAAAATNGLGQGRLSIVALHVPGDYVLTIYAEKRGAGAIARTTLKVRRRGSLL